MPQLGLMKQEIRGFLGVNLRKERLDLADEELAKAINADLHTQPGTIVLRLGRTRQFTTALTDFAIRRLAKINSKRYQIAGTNVYRDQTSILSGLSTNLITTVIPFRPLNDTAIWAFIADNALMRKDNGTNVRKWGIAAPTAIATQIGVGTALTGAYTGRTTEIRFDGTKVAHESSPSPISTSVTLTSQTLAFGDVLSDTDAQVNGLGFYRTVSDGSVHLLDARVSIPIETLYGVTHTWEVSALTGIQFHWSILTSFSVGAEKVAGTGANDSSVGTRTWSNSNLITSSDDNYASAATGAGGAFTNYLKATNFGFAIALTETIQGISVSVERNKAGAAVVSDVNARIVKLGEIKSQNKSSGSLWPTTDESKVFGGISDLWGETWTPEDINSTNFGFALSALIDGAITNSRVDAITITVYTGSSAVSARASQTWEPAGSGNGEDAAGAHATHLWEITDGYVTTQTKRWAYHSSIADTALGAAVETDNDVPPNAAWAVAHQEHVFLCRDESNPHYLWFSKRFRPEAVAAANFLEIGNPDDPLQCAVQTGGLLGVFSRLTKYRVLGNIVSGFVAQEALSSRGTPSPMACIGTERGAIFPARDGVFLTNFIAADDNLSGEILPLFMGETMNGMSPINWDQALLMSAETYKGRYYLSYAAGASVTPNRVAVFSSDTRKWYFFDHPLRSLFVEEDVDDLTAGGLDGFVYILEDGSTDAGTNISLDVETKDYAGGEESTRKLFRHFRVDADADGDTLTAVFYVDGTLIRSASVTGTRTKVLLQLPEKTMGYQWRVNFTYTGSKRPRIYGVAAMWLPLSAA
jgi:hypothetical protein